MRRLPQVELNSKWFVLSAIGTFLTYLIPLMMLTEYRLNGAILHYSSLMLLFFIVWVNHRLKLVNWVLALIIAFLIASFFASRYENVDSFVAVLVAIAIFSLFHTAFAPIFTAVTVVIILYTIAAHGISGAIFIPILEVVLEHPEIPPLIGILFAIGNAICAHLPTILNRSRAS